MLGDALLQPEDDLALGVVLKGPLLGLGEDDLYKLAHGREGSLWQALERDPGYGECDSSVASFPRMRESISEAGTSSHMGPRLRGTTLRPRSNSLRPTAHTREEARPVARVGAEAQPFRFLRAYSGSGGRPQGVWRAARSGMLRRDLRMQSWRWPRSSVPGHWQASRSSFPSRAKVPPRLSARRIRRRARSAS